MVVSENQINVLLNFITKGQQSFLNAQKKIDTFSKNINKNNKVIAEQQQLQQQGVKGTGAVINSLNAENQGYVKQQKAFKTGMGDINKEIGANKKRLGMSQSIMESQKLQEISGYSAGQVMRMNVKDLGKYNEMGGTFANTQAKMANNFRMMTHGTRGFKMEMLGVMFFGMAMKRMFNGLIKTSLEWVGIQELLNTTLGVVFLPIAEQLLDFLLPIMMWFMDLPEPIKNIIGGITLLGIALGGLLFTIGTLVLGIGSMILAFNFSKIATIIGSSGLGGISTAATTAATNIGGLKTKLGTLAKYAGAAIAFSVALDDAAEGKLTAAVGDMLIGIGFLKGGKAGAWSMALGITLKLLGDEDFLKSVIKGLLKVVDLAIWAGEAIVNALKGKKIDWGPITHLGGVFQEAIAEYAAAGTVSKTMADVLKPTLIEEISTKTQELRNDWGNGIITQKEYTDSLDDMNTKYGDSIKMVDDYINSLADYIVMVNRLKNTSMVDSLNATQGISLNDYLNNNTDYGLDRVSDAIINPNGNIISTNPRDYLIATKNPSNLVGNGTQVINVSYNVNVSDKREFEQMLRANNENLTREVRRLTS